MRKFILAGAAVIVVGGVFAGVAVTKAGAETDPAALLLAFDDPPPGAAATLAMVAPPEAPDDDAMVLAQASPPPPGMPRPGMDGRPGWMHGGPPPRPMWHRAAMFGLFFHPEDKQLTPADVQKIAEAFLLWQGNRDWKVTQVSAAPDGKIGFAFATSDGGVIARFTMDSKTGKLERVG
jgi:hypothetical protein